MKKAKNNSVKTVLPERRWPLAAARAIAERVVELLRPFCKRIEIAGSIRRCKPDVGDIEVLCVPLPYSTGIFEDGLAKVVNQWRKIRGEMEYGKARYTQRELPEGIKLDLFMVEESSWGYHMGIRTGSDQFSHEVLAKGWRRQGFSGKGGHLEREGEIYPVREEKDLFDLIGIPFIKPERREL
jgi:DNA polymerase/3'-5' exonuclease PolX